MPRPGNAASRGYGWDHQQARARYIRDMQDGQPCVRCGGPLYRSMGKLLHLDHDGPRTGYRGLAHARCNTQAGGRARQAQVRAARASTTSATTRHSRRW